MPVAQPAAVTVKDDCRQHKILPSVCVYVLGQSEGAGAGGEKLLQLNQLRFVCGKDNCSHNTVVIK